MVSNTWYKIKYKNGRVQEAVCFHKEINLDSDEDLNTQDERVYKKPSEEPIKTIEFQKELYKKKTKGVMEKALKPLPPSVL